MHAARGVHMCVLSIESGARAGRARGLTIAHARAIDDRSYDVDVDVGSIGSGRVDSSRIRISIMIMYMH